MCMCMCMCMCMEEVTLSPHTLLTQAAEAWWSLHVVGLRARGTARVCLLAWRWKARVSFTVLVAGSHLVRQLFRGIHSWDCDCKYCSKPNMSSTASEISDSIVAIPSPSLSQYWKSACVSCMALLGVGTWYMSPIGGVLWMAGGGPKSSFSVTSSSACSGVGSTTKSLWRRCLLFWNHTVTWCGVTLSVSASFFRVVHDGRLSS